MRLLLTCLSLSLLLILSTVGSAWSSGANKTVVNGANNTAVSFDDTSLQKLLAEYVNWDLNLSDKQMPTSNASANQCVIKPGSVNFLTDPFSRGAVTQTCKINSGSSLLFPFYIGFCDNGGAGNYGEQSFQKILSCALDSDKGIVTMEGWLDGSKIIDIKVNNKDPSKLKQVYNNLPQHQYYKEIKSKSFFNQTVTNNTRLAGSYQNQTDFQSSPATYKAAGHCFCGLIPSLSPGTHELRYKTVIEGTGGIETGKGWDQETDLTYKLNVQ